MKSKILIIISLILIYPVLVISEENSAEKNYSTWNTEQLINELNSNPHLAEDLKDIDFARAIETNPALLSNPSILEQTNKRVEKNPSILNDNINAKKQWFSKYNIIDNGAKINSFKGDEIKTEGPKSTIFNIKDVPGATVQADGRLTRDNGDEFANSQINKNNEGVLTISGGDVLIRSMKNVNYQMINTRITIDEFDDVFTDGTTATLNKMEIKSEKPIKFTSDKEKWTLIGENVKIIDKTQYTKVQPEMTVTGTISRSYPKTSLDFPKFTLGENSDIFIKKDNENVKIHVLKPTTISTYSSCFSNNGCIHIKNDRIDIVSENNNVLNIESNSKIKLHVASIKDDSKVTFTEKQTVTISFSKDFPRIKGDVSRIESSIRCELQDGKASHEFMIEDRKVSICSNCLVLGGLTNELINAIGRAKIASENKAIQGDIDMIKIQNKIGVRPSWWLGSIANPDNSNDYVLLIEAAKKQGLSPELVVAAGLQENMDQILGKGPDQSINGKYHFQLDQFWNEVKTLKEQGYLPNDYDEGDEYRLQKPSVNEFYKKETPPTEEDLQNPLWTIKAPTFKNIDSAITAFTAVLKSRQDMFIRDAKALGINTNALTQDQLTYWTYAYYNAPSSAKNRLVKNGIKISTTTITEEERKSPKVAETNARVVYATAKLLEEKRIFQP